MLPVLGEHSLARRESFQFPDNSDDVSPSKDVSFLGIEYAVVLGGDDDIVKLLDVPFCEFLRVDSVACERGARDFVVSLSPARQINNNEDSINKQKYYDVLNSIENLVTTCLASSQRVGI